MVRKRALWSQAVVLLMGIWQRYKFVDGADRGGQYTTYEAALSADLPVGISALANIGDLPKSDASRNCTGSAKWDRAWRIRKYNPFIPAGFIPVRADPNGDSQY